MRTKNFKVVVAVVALFSMSTGAFAQDGRISIGAELGLPMGDFGDAASTGFGGTVRYEMQMGDNLGLTGTAGYLMFGGKEEGSADRSFIPIQLGAKYYFTGQQEGFYGMLELGFHSSSYKTEDIEVSGVTVYEGETISSTDFSLAPAVGYHLDNIDLGLRYQNISSKGGSTSYLGLRIAYVLGAK